MKHNIVAVTTVMPLSEKGSISALSTSSLQIGAENSPLSGKDYSQPLVRQGEYSLEVLHIMIVSADGERETAFDIRIGSFQIRIFQSTGRQHGLLRVVESYGKEFVPVTNKILLHDNLVDS